MVFELGLWNVEWASAKTTRLREMLSLLLAPNTAVICLAEAHAGSLDESWHEITSHPDAGYGSGTGRRKVILASKNAWHTVDDVGDPNLPGGRFVSGITLIEGRETRVIGICVPWHFAHVSTGRRDRRPWEDHIRYLNVLSDVLERQTDAMPTIILGDLNQWVPRRTAPKEAFKTLQDALLRRYAVATAGLLGPLGAQTIDHVLHSEHFDTKNIRVFDNVGADGRRLSDHVGLSVELTWSNSGRT